MAFTLRLTEHFSDWLDRLADKRAQVRSAAGDVARAKGMAQVAKQSGLGRESLYKALAPGAKPRFDTVLKVARALGVRFCARAA